MKLLQNKKVLIIDQAIKNSLDYYKEHFDYSVI